MRVTNFKLKLIFCFLIAIEVQAKKSILDQADEYRNPSQSFSMEITVKDDDANESQFEVFIRGRDKTLIVTKKPTKDKGRNMLMLERDFHAYVPNLKRTMRLSLAQKLSGQVANGDIARTRWSGDYDIQSQKVRDKEKELFLKAVGKNLTYEWIRLWVETKSAKPLRAEYLALNGKTLLKTAYFENYQILSGKLRPTLIRIKSPDEKESRIEVSKMTSKDFEDSFFTIRNMESQR
jgi:hypothetical protein